MARWRILNRPLDVNLEFALTMIYNCFVLHNFCEKNKVDISNDAVSTQISAEQRCQDCRHYAQVDKLYSYNSSQGRKVRDILVEYFSESF